MAVFEWVRFLAGAAFLLGGLGIFLIEMIGVFRFKYVLNRMHAAAMGDTFGIGCALVGLILMSGLNFTSLKLLLVIVFLWFASPVSSHLLARLEVTTNEDEEQHYRVVTLKELEADLETRAEAAAEEQQKTRAEAAAEEQQKTRAEAVAEEQQKTQAEAAAEEEQKTQAEAAEKDDLKTQAAAAGEE